MKVPHTFLAVAGSLALAAPATAAVTVDFTENFDGNFVPESIAIPTVTGFPNVVDPKGGAVGSVELKDFFGTTNLVGFSATYSLLEPGTKDDVSDQITFSAVEGSHGSSSLLITFTSDPAKFITGDKVYGSSDETDKNIPLPKKFGEFLVAKDMTVSAQSDPNETPEPATWMMLLLGFGVTGLALRRSVDTSLTKRKGRATKRQVLLLFGRFGWASEAVFSYCCLSR